MDEIYTDEFKSSRLKNLKRAKEIKDDLGRRVREIHEKHFHNRHVALVISFPNGRDRPSVNFILSKTSGGKSDAVLSYVDDFPARAQTVIFNALEDLIDYVQPRPDLCKCLHDVSNTGVVVFAEEPR